MKWSMPHKRGKRGAFPSRKGSHKRFHGHLVGLFAAAAIFLLILNAAVVLTPVHVAQATPTSPAYLGAGAGTDGTTTLNVPHPTGIVANDLLIMQVSARHDSSSSANTPAGWTLIAGPDTTISATMRQWIFSKIAVGSESGTQSVTFTAGAHRKLARMYLFRGTVTSGYVEGSALNRGTVAAVSPPNVVTSDVGRLAVAFVAADDDNFIASFSGESGGDWTEATAEHLDTGAAGMLQLQTATMQSGGTVSGGSIGMSGDDDWSVRAFALVGLDTTPSSANIAGWAWSDTGGWISMNSSNAGSGGGTYGVDFDISTRAVSGWGWSENQGWVCFGSTCTAGACAGAAAVPSGGASTASIDSSSPPQMHGWAMICNLGAPNGWISLNCTEPGTCGTSTYRPTMDTVSGNFTGYTWHNLTGPMGWGWIDFSLVRGPYEQSLLTCHDTINNDADSTGTDCADNGCYQQTVYNCPANERTDCGLIGNSNCCGNGIDDDNDGPVDCADSNCSADPLCTAEICDNGIDDNSNSLIDCADTVACSGFPACTPAWIRSNYGNIYAQAGVGGNAPPAGQTNASYCITSAGAISNFTSASGCVEASQAQQSYNLPSSCNGYVTSLGKLDVAGILAGRYGQVVNIANDAALPQLLAGKVYVYDRDAQGGNCPSGGNNFNVSAKVFNNASGSNGRGNGTLVVKGCDIQIIGNLSYQAAGVSQYLRNMASLGIISLAKYTSCTPQTGGNIYFSTAVTQSVGMIFAERSIQTGSTGGAFTDVALDHYGAFVSRDIQLQRRYGSPTEPAEEVIFDGRGVVNPPPGMQDITKSLPTLRDTF